MRTLSTLTCAVASALSFAQPAFPREMRAVWVATVSNIDWPTSKTLTPTAQRNEVITILTRAKALNLNAVLVQVRPACDAFYPSAIEPWSPYLTNAMGQAPNPLYDPLAYWIEEAHKRGIEVHAWLNPYRALASTSTATSANHISRTRPDIVRTYGTALWLDPGHPDAQDYSRSVINDIVARYDIDGLVFDDYFYPYPISGTPFPDSSTYAAYGNGMSLSDWRRDNVNRFIQNVYNDIKDAKRWVKFGISPFGIWRPGYPAGVTGLDAYAEIYADSRKWLQQGWLDYFSPQLYWKISATGQPYVGLLQWWIQQNTLGRFIAPSNYTSNLSSGLGNWAATEITDQIQQTRNQSGASGNIHFSERAFRSDYKGIYGLLVSNAYSTAALMPRYFWLDNVRPATPVLTMTPDLAPVDEVNNKPFAWQPQGSEATWVYAIYLKYGSTWTYKIVPSTQTAYSALGWSGNSELTGFAVAAVDRNGNESYRAVWP